MLFFKKKVYNVNYYSDKKIQMYIMDGIEKVYLGILLIVNLILQVYGGFGMIFIDVCLFKLVISKCCDEVGSL